MTWSTLATIVQAIGIVVGSVFALMMTTSLIASRRYETDRGEERAEDVRFVIPTVASENVRSALIETIEHTVERFPQYEVYCVIDEGSDLQADLLARDDISTIVVPDSYDPDAIAKGRAIEYFVETVVADAPEYWYGFIDDDNRILDDAFLREIPHYEARGYRAMNPVLLPRQGRSVVTFLADHIRLVDDLAIYRLFTGVLETPYLGFHGELLCVRGDVLSEIGFDRETVVEDFAFALELAKEGIPVWQSATRVSVLSPHDATSFLEQRSRWYLGIARYLPAAPLVSRAVVGARIATWSVAVTSSWVFLPLWLLGYGLALPGWLLWILGAGTLLYVATIAVGAVRIGGLRGAALLALAPVCATLEHVVPLYAVLSGEREFVVINK
jgi:cellulose synthase/poly-beta-1,6-N-acetylglucosamine synthase-like glycosyltransferase